jgi:hypothetical protein
MATPDYPIAAPPVDDPLELVRFILRLYDEPDLLHKYSGATYEARLDMLKSDAPKVKDEIHRQALAKGDAPRLHVALTHNLGLQVHALDCALTMERLHNSLRESEPRPTGEK